jgi:hypothetical protein
MNKKDRKLLYETFKSLLVAAGNHPVKYVDEFGDRESSIEATISTVRYGSVWVHFYGGLSRKRPELFCQLKDWENPGLNASWRGFYHWKQNCHVSYIDSVDHVIRKFKEHLHMLGVPGAQTLSESRFENLKNAFIELRAAWFSTHLERRSHERQWEDEEDADLREAGNAELRSIFDADTGAIIDGETRLIKPYTPQDVYSFNEKRKAIERQVDNAVDNILDKVGHSDEPG